MCFSDLSKQVGLSPRSLKFPTMAEVDKASDYQVFEWNRHLRSAENDVEIEIQNKIFEKFKELQKRLSA